MDAIPSQQLISWSARINAFAEITSFIALLLFFARGGFWGPLNDTLSVIWALTLVPLAWWFFQTNRLFFPPLNTLAAVLGIGSMLLFALLQGALVLRVVRYEQTVSLIMTLIGVIGVWLTVNALLSGMGRVLPAGMIWVMMIFGMGLLLSAVGFWLGGERHPLAAIGYFAGSIAGMVWPLWMANWLKMSA